MLAWELLSLSGMRTVFDTVDALQRAMSFQRERHGVIARNLANLDTPGYRPFDLAEAEGPRPPATEVIAATDARHLQPATSTDTPPAKLVADTTSEADLDGNAVSLEKELAKIDENRVRYSTATELVSRRLALLRYAAGDGTP